MVYCGQTKHSQFISGSIEQVWFWHGVVYKEKCSFIQEIEWKHVDNFCIEKYNHIKNSTLIGPCQQGLVYAD